MLGGTPGFVEDVLFEIHAGAAEAMAANSRAVDRCDDRAVLAGVIGMAVRDVAAVALAHGVDPEVDRRHVKRLFGERKHGEANVRSARGIRALLHLLDRSSSLSRYCSKARHY